MLRQLQIVTKPSPSTLFVHLDVYQSSAMCRVLPPNIPPLLFTKDVLPSKRSSDISTCMAPINDSRGKAYKTAIDYAIDARQYLGIYNSESHNVPMRVRAQIHGIYATTGTRSPWKPKVSGSNGSAQLPYKAPLTCSL